MYTVSLVDSVYTAQICLCCFYVFYLSNSVWFGSGCQGRVFHQPKQPSKTGDISVFIAPLAEREGLCYALFIFSAFVSSVPSPFLYFFAFCTSSPSLFCSWLGTHEKYSSRGEKCWARHLPHLSYSEKQHRKLCARRKHDIKSEANLALNWSKSDITSGSRELCKSSV